MKQVLQSARTGEIQVGEVPAPRVLPGCLLVRIAASLVSAGTERASSDFAAKSLLQKARSRPDLLRELLNKVRRDGVVSAMSAVRSRLDQPAALGYSSSGTVMEVGEGITDMRPGDRVACAGAGFAVHAEFACVPRLLVARIPSAEVDLDSAAFTTIGAVAIHGVRTAEAKLGDVVAVIGLGLVGQLLVQTLKAAGCRVIGMDPVQERAQLAAKLGALAVAASETEFRDSCLSHSGGHGADSVVIAAETPSDGPVNLASEVARDRGVIVAVGTVGMELQRKLYYEKELDFRVSRSYGPGRYDAAFEQKGRDYPIGYVRWSETRNMEAFLQLLADRKLDLKPLITHSFAIENAGAAYELITGKTQQPHLGVVIRYPHRETPLLAKDARNGVPGESARRLDLIPRRAEIAPPSHVRVGVLGAGNFARSILIPAIQAAPATQLVGLYAANGARSRSSAGRFGFAFCATDEEEIYSDSSINTIAIASRHHLHAAQVIRGLECGKNVFCEKPLCLNEEELAKIEHAYSRCGAGLRLMVGFNRRFALMARRMKDFLSSGGGRFVMHYRVNAGPLPKDHWIEDPEQGGGRILGEVCHFMDFLSFLCGSPPVTVNARSLTSAGGGQDVIASLEFGDGSLGTISYLCSGDLAFAKERVEVFGGGSVAVLNDFRRLELVRHGRRNSYRSWLKPDKGHAAEWKVFSKCIQSGQPTPISFEEIAASTLATIRIVDSLRSGHKVKVRHNPLETISAPLVS